jgi:hypothetical protein
MRHLYFSVRRFINRDVKHEEKPKAVDDGSLSSPAKIEE